MGFILYLQFNLQNRIIDATVYDKIVFVLFFAVIEKKNNCRDLKISPNIYTIIFYTYQ